MRRSLSCRVVSLVLSLWVPLFMSGSESIVRCPTHDGTTAVAAQTGAPASAAADHDHGGTHSAPADHADSHSCSCPGPGCCPPAVAVVPGAQLPLATIVAIHEATAVSTLERFASESDHVLPFATAPPPATLAPATSSAV